MSVDPHAILQRIESIYGPLPEGVPTVSYVYEPGVNGQCLYISPSIERVLGYAQEDWISDGGLWDRLLHPEDADRVINAEAECASSGEALVQEYRISRADGRVIWIRDEMTVVRGDDGQHEPLFFGAFMDVTDRKRMEAELERLALYDSLTGLPNRALFSDRLDQAIAHRSRTQAIAVYFLDVDRFKRINDSLGHVAGDEVLREVAARIQRMLRPEDTVARFGGRRVHGAVRVDRRRARGGGRGGPASARDRAAAARRRRGAAAERLDRHRDGRARRGRGRLAAGGGRGRRDVPGEGARRRAHRAVRHGDARARRGRDLDRAGAVARARARRAAALLPAAREPPAGEMVGAEALIRWEHPERGLLTPDKFLPIAEESGLIVQVGAWAVGEACRRLRDWDRRNGGPSNFSLAVNLSARELTHPDVVPTVLNAVRRSALDPHRLTIEVTESTAMADRDSGFRALRELHDAGVRIAIDDFGTGYSSLDHLREMPADILKIDRSFVAGMSANSPDTALVAAAIAMGRALEMEVVAEGIETSEQVADLRELGCPLGQGFLFARPLPPEEIDTLLGADIHF